MSSAAPAASLSIDGLAPSSIVEPASVDVLAAALAEANEHGAAVIPWGAGAHMALGNVPRRYDLALRTTKLNRVIEYEPADLTITVEAGTTMGRLQALLAEQRQFLPIDAPAEATVGGVLAANASGASRHAYGLPRDWLIGCRAALADGTLIKGGGRVVKNVAGYDLPKLFVGSLGTLGVVVEATFKVAPLPPAQETLLVTCASIDEAARLVAVADDRGLALRGVAIRHGAGETAAAFWLAGPSAAVERTRREIEELAVGRGETLVAEQSESWWRSLVEFESAPHGGVMLRTSLPPTGVREFLSSVVAASSADTSLDAVVYATTGLVIVRVDTRDIEQLLSIAQQARARAVAAGGSLVITSARLEVKQRIDVWGDVPGLALMRRLKEEFDPKATLNPGRFARGI